MFATNSISLIYRNSKETETRSIVLSRSALETLKFSITIQRNSHETLHRKTESQEYRR